MYFQANAIPQAHCHRHFQICARRLLGSAPPLLPVNGS
jgi:hypothetical protein